MPSALLWLPHEWIERCPTVYVHVPTNTHMCTHIHDVCVYMYEYVNYRIIIILSINNEISKLRL